MEGAADRCLGWGLIRRGGAQGWWVGVPRGLAGGVGHKLLAGGQHQHVSSQGLGLLCRCTLTD